MLSPVFEKLTINSLRGRIAEQLREAILHGTLREGQRIVERNLAAQLGASLTAVREALIELEMEGFITKKPSSATYVTRLSPRETEKLFEVRMVLECYAVEQAAVSGTPQQLERLESMYMDMLDAARSRDMRAFLKRDYAVHEMIWQMADNEYVQAALRRVVLPLFGFSTIRLANRDAFDLLRDAQTHLPIIQAIKTKDPQTARAALAEALGCWFKSTRDYVLDKESRVQPIDAFGVDAGLVEKPRLKRAKAKTERL